MATKRPPKQPPARLINKLRGNQLVRFASLWLLAYAILLSFFFRTVLRNFAYIEIFPHELVFPLAMHAVTALLITVAFFWIRWYKSYLGKLISVVVMALLVVGYDANLQAVAGPIKAFMPGLTSSDPLPLVSLVYLIMLILLALGIGLGGERLISRQKRLQPRDFELGMAVLVAYLLLMPLLSLGRILPAMVRESSVQAAEFKPPATATADASDKPDIFYIVLDRYTNADVLQKQFNYDNSPFTGFLRDNDFYVNDQAYGNYPYTTMSVSSTMNARYTNDLVAPFTNNDVQSRTLYHNLIWQSSVAKALKKSGYKYYTLGSWYGATYKAPLADIDYKWEHLLTVFGVNKRLRGIEAGEFNQSPYYRFAQTGISWWPLKAADNDHISDVRQQLNLLDDLTTKDKPGGRFIFAHILVPHDPFVFNGDCSLSANPGTDSNGQPLKDKYVGQVECISSQMKELVANIQKQSQGKAVIVFNADEGAYPQTMNDSFKKPTDGNSIGDSIVEDDNMTKWSDDWLKMKFGVLQAVHIPAASQDDLDHLSSVNVFRIILNRYAGYQLDYLPECHFGLTNGSKNEYLYSDITKKFTDTPDPTCQKLQTTK